MDNDNTFYKNYRCRKCGQFLSVRTNVQLLSREAGVLVRKGNHMCPSGIQDDEAILADLISVTEEAPIGELLITSSGGAQ